MGCVMTHSTLLPMNSVITIALIGLCRTSLYSFLLFHALAELFSILVAFSICTIAWNARRLLGGSHLVLLGLACLCGGGIDILHSLACEGMGVFPAELRLTSAKGLFANPRDASLCSA
jgi:hypothetical protein